MNARRITATTRCWHRVIWAFPPSCGLRLIDDPAEFDIALVGIPYDGAVTNRPGARHGPREVRNASSMMRAIHPTSRVNPYELCRVGDGGDVSFTRLYEFPPLRISRGSSPGSRRLAPASWPWEVITPSLYRFSADWFLTARWA